MTITGKLNIPPIVHLIFGKFEPFFFFFAKTHFLKVAKILFVYQNVFR